MNDELFYSLIDSAIKYMPYSEGGDFETVDWVCYAYSLSTVAQWNLEILSIVSFDRRSLTYIIVFLMSSRIWIQIIYSNIIFLESSILSQIDTLDNKVYTHLPT